MSKVTFKLNKNLDKQMAVEFLNVEAAGIDFSNGVFSVHPEIDFLKKEKNEDKIKKVISGHFDSFYSQHKDYLQKKVNEFQKDWNSVNEDFWSGMEEIFGNYKFPKKNYTGYISIIDCNPRFLKKGAFQVFYFHPLGVKYVAAHELMHFIFYDYAIKKFPELFGKLDTEEGLFWNVAEIFNAVVLRDSIFVNIHKVEGESCYPDHKKYLAKLDKEWQRNRNIDDLILKIHQVLKS